MRSPRTVVAENPPRTLVSLIALALPPLTILVTRWLDSMLADDPELHAAALAFALAAVTYLLSRLGKWAQRFTEPRAVYDELLAIRSSATFTGGAEDADPDPEGAIRLDPGLPAVPSPDGFPTP